MTPPREFFPPRSRLLVGGLLLVATVGLTWGAWYSYQGPIRALAWFEQNATPRDSVGYSNAVYHAAWAQEAEDNRWSPTGYATLGTIGVGIGAGLILSARRRNAP